MKLGSGARRWIREVGPMVRLALPIMAGMVGQMLMGIVDTVMVARVGVVPLAAAAFVNAVAHLPLVFGLGLLSSVAVLGAQCFGANRPAEVGEVLRHGAWLAFVLGSLSAIGLAALQPWAGLLGQPEEVIAEAGPYLVLFGASIAPALFGHACKQFSEALNHAWAPTFLLLAAVLLNVALNWVFIYGHLGVPALGLEGAGWATLIARAFLAAGIVVFVLRARGLRPYQPVRWLARVDLRWIRRLLEVGWPVGMQHFLEVSAFAFSALMMGWISAEAIAAHQIAITCAATTFMFALGIGMAACIRVGQAWGAGQLRRMRRIGVLGMGMAAGVMGVFGIAFIFGGDRIASWFVDSPEVVHLTAQLLLVAAFFQVADGVQVSAISALRGLSDVRVPALITVLAYWVVAVPLGSVLAFGLDLGPIGIWTGLALGLGIAAALLSWRFVLRSRHAGGRN